MSKVQKEIVLNAFVQHSVSPHAIGLWKHPDHIGSTHNQLNYWTNLAERLEKAGFDAVFIADVLGVYDVYEGTVKHALHQALQVPAHDPFIIIPAMAQVTEKLGFALTASTTYYPPYLLARKFSTLDHLTNGRIGWNIVTSYLESEAVNLGLDGLIEHDERYERAEEYLDVVYKLWQQSWEEGAVVRNVESNQYIASEKVHPIEHTGEYFNVPGIHLVEPSPQRTPLLFQAGASKRGIAFAAKHAEVIFTNTQNQKEGLEQLQQFNRELTTELERNGRSREDVKVVPALVIVIGETEQLAREKFEYLKSFVDYDGAAALLSGHSGIDFSIYDRQSFVEDIPSPGMQSRLNSYTSTDPSKKWTIEEAILYHGLTLGSEAIVGTKEQVANRLEQLIAEGQVDGFNIRQTVAPESFVEFIEEVLPILKERGFIPTSKRKTTLRETYFGEGHAQLPTNHYGSTVRIKDSVAVK